MAERLREVAKELPADWIDLLGQQADLIDEGGGTRPLSTVIVNGAWYFRGARATESRTTCTTVRRYQGVLNTS